MAGTDGQSWKVGQLARLAGLTVRTLHHYDQVGLLSPSARTPSGHRLYGEPDVHRLYRIVALRELGLSLEVIGDLLTGEPDLPDLLRQHLAHGGMAAAHRAGAGRTGRRHRPWRTGGAGTGAALDGTAGVLPRRRPRPSRLAVSHAG
ncbi:MAG TPA: MerR family transcriptional regulator [Pseudonocardiaceae bacterium]|nr:MerR family transcriptional regulator [Pseudonocardiaceae bacterium]